MGSGMSLIENENLNLAKCPCVDLSSVDYDTTVAVLPRASSDRSDAVLIKGLQAKFNLKSRAFISRLDVGFFEDENCCT
jgi:hypothetical protein